MYDEFEKEMGDLLNSLSFSVSEKIIDDELKKKIDDLGRKARELQDEEQDFELSKPDLVDSLERQVEALKYSNECQELKIEILVRQVKAYKAVMEVLELADRLSEAAGHQQDGVIKYQKAKIEKYKKGLKKKFDVSQEKWELARKYFAEEIPKHKTLNGARQAAANKARISVGERQLIKMLPNPRR